MPKQQSRFQQKGLLQAAGQDAADGDNDGDRTDDYELPGLQMPGGDDDGGDDDRLLQGVLGLEEGAVGAEPQNGGEGGVGAELPRGVLGRDDGGGRGGF